MELSKEERKKIKAEQRAAKEIAKFQESLSSGTKITVLCVRFGNRYGREYVERLRNMVGRNLNVPYDFVCLTDDKHPIEGVRSIYQPNANYSKGWWHKVHMFDPNLPLAGRILYFDLDIVIHNNIDKLALLDPHKFLGILDFNRKFYSNWKYLNSSVMAWNHGEETDIWEQFKKNNQSAMSLQGDQDWIWKIARERIQFWPKKWIQSYKWEIRSREQLTVVNGKRRFREEDHSIEVDPECCVTVFHGDPKPQDVQDKFVVDNWK